MLVVMYVCLFQVYEVKVFRAIGVQSVHMERVGVHEPLSLKDAYSLLFSPCTQTNWFTFVFQI